MVANLTRYDMGVVECSIGNDVDIIPVANGEFVKFEEAKEASLNNVQQLKAEIAAALYEYDDILHNPYGNPLDGLLSRLRRLSAV